MYESQKRSKSISDQGEEYKYQADLSCNDLSGAVPAICLMVTSELSI
jgi:hypothetical protein